MGSPISFLNLTLNITKEHIQVFLANSPRQTLQWNNIIQAADIIAYPLCSLFETLPSTIHMQDYYLEDEVNKLEFILKQVEITAVAASAFNAHEWYWKSEKVARLITESILGCSSVLQNVIDRLKKIPGITDDQTQFSKKLNIEQTLIVQKFKDGSGAIQMTKDTLGLYHVYVFDYQDNYLFVGFVGWIHVEGLIKVVELIVEKFC